LAPYELNVQQQQAWADSVDENRPVALVQGPPGTGKTQVITAIIRTLVEKGKRVLVAAPSNTATDNICRRILDLPVLRFGKHEDSVHPDVVSSCWVGDIENVKRYAAKRNEFAGTGAYTGTPVGLLRSDIVQSDFEKNGPFDCLIFDEASMSRTDVFLLCANLAKRLVLFGDHQQLPPFPLLDCVLKDLNDGLGPFTSSEETLLKGSALEWLHNARNCPLLTLSCTYRCQNPRLLRFASTLFYNALVHVSPDAEFFQLDYKQRKEAFPASTLQLMITSQLPAEERNEQVHVAPGEMGFYNECEAKHCVEQFISYLGRYAFEQIQILTPYRCQMKRIRELLREADLPGKPTDEDEAGLEAYNNEIDARVRTVDGFQGAEADAVIISYVRSNPQGSVGFVADHNRINVAHTRCRRELTVVADIQFLKDNADTDIFARMERAFQRDGIVIDVNK
jgi:superfamily I DNA and/or RNA helicase